MDIETMAAQAQTLHRTRPEAYLHFVAQLHNIRGQRRASGPLRWKVRRVLALLGES